MSHRRMPGAAFFRHGGSHGKPRCQPVRPGCSRQQFAEYITERIESHAQLKLCAENASPIPGAVTNHATKTLFDALTFEIHEADRR